MAVSGAIRDEILPLEEVAAWAMRFLMQHKPELLEKRYAIELDEDPYSNFTKIAEKRGFLKNGKEIDFKRTIETFLREIRDDRLGSITWENADEV